MLACAYMHMTTQLFKHSCALQHTMFVDSKFKVGDKMGEEEGGGGGNTMIACASLLTIAASLHSPKAIQHQLFNELVEL